jgi:protease I
MRILLLTGDAGESQEIYYPLFRLQEEGWTVDVSAPEKRVIRSVVHDFEPGFDTFTEKPGYLVRADVAFVDVDPSRYDALVLPGGRAPEFLRTKPKAVAIVKHFLDAAKPIAATCHGPLLIIAAGGAQGRTMSCYPDLAIDLERAGAKFVDSEAYSDGQIVSCRAWSDNGPWMREFVRLLHSRTTRPGPGKGSEAPTRL